MRKHAGAENIMQETKPLLLLKKYRSILTSAIAVEVVVFAVSLTDTIAAGNGSEIWRIADRK